MTPLSSLTKKTGAHFGQIILSTLRADGSFNFNASLTSNREIYHGGERADPRTCLATDRRLRQGDREVSRQTPRHGHALQEVGEAHFSMILHSPGSASGHGYGRHWLPSMERGPTMQVERFVYSCRTHVDSTLVHKLVASWGTYTELLRFRIVSTAWSDVETPYEVLEHRIWEIAAGHERKFRSSVCQHVADCQVVP